MSGNKQQLDFKEGCEANRPRVTIFATVSCAYLSLLFFLGYQPARELLRGLVGYPMYVFAPLLSATGTIAIACANVVLVVVALNMCPDRPEFKLMVETQSNRERLSDRSAQEKERMRIRLKVQNCSKKVTARNCIAKIEFESKNGRTPMESSSLHWNRLYYPLDLVEFKQDRPFWVSATASIDIRPGEAELLDVAFAPIWGEDAFEEGIEEKRAQTFTSNWSISRRKGIDQLEPGSYDVKITIYSDNADPKPTKIGLKYTKDSDLTPTQIDCSQET